MSYQSKFEPHGTDHQDKDANEFSLALLQSIGCGEATDALAHRQDLQEKMESMERLGDSDWDCHWQWECKVTLVENQKAGVVECKYLLGSLDRPIYAE
jgi:hypothetical protein